MVRRLRILATSDLHAHVFPWDYHADRAHHGVGLARTARLIERFRSGVPSILLDNGDFLTGSPMADAIAVQPEAADRPHPVVAAMNCLRYDAATPGNHEFNHGLGFLARVLADANFPVTSANVLDRRRGTPVFPPFLLIDRDLSTPGAPPMPVRIGVIGFLPPQTMTWDSDVLGGEIETPDILAAAREWVPRMRAAGAEVVVALAHTGIGTPEPAPGQEDAATALARVPGIDAIVAGHSHLVFPSPRFAGQAGVDAAAGRIGGIPAVMPGAFGSHLGVIDLALEQTAQVWRVADARAEVHAIARQDANGTVAVVDSCDEVLAAVAADHAATVAQMRQRVGRTSQRLTTHFALVSDSAALRAVAAAKVRHVARQLRGTPWERLPILAAAAPFRVGGRGGPEKFTLVPPGPVARRNLADLYPFPNRLRAVRATGADIVEWLERSAAIFRRLVPGADDQPLIDPRFPGYNFDTLPGLSYVVDPTQPPRYDLRGDVADPAARRIRDLRFDGRAVDPGATFVVVTSAYRLSVWPGLARAPNRVITPDDRTTGEEALAAWAADGGLERIGVARSWRLHLPPGTSALIHTAPEADPRELAGSGLKAEPRGIDDDGFAVMRLSAENG